MNVKTQGNIKLSRKILSESRKILADSRNFFQELGSLYDQFRERTLALETREIGLSGVVEDYR